jgi:hypothetical protein
MSQLPIYVQYLSAISTPIIALMVAMIAFAQWRTARQRMILDLFQRRMDLIDLVSRVASTIVIEGALRAGLKFTPFTMRSALAAFRKQ